jgi:hypothetical protein
MDLFTATVKEEGGAADSSSGQYKILEMIRHSTFIIDEDISGNIFSSSLGSGGGEATWLEKLRHFVGDEGTSGGDVEDSAGSVSSSSETIIKESRITDLPQLVSVERKRKYVAERVFFIVVDNSRHVEMYYY